LVLDRFEGGGATALSGGVYYGGATRHLRAAGFHDTPDAMYRYLKLETGDVVSDALLRRFCEESSANLEWLEAHGVRFGSKVDDGKRSYPLRGYDLYYSGNERVAGYKEAAVPAPRGHRTAGKNFTGGVLFETLQRSASAKGVRLLVQAAVTRLVVDADGKVAGVEARVLPSESPAAKQHRRLIGKVNAWQRFFAAAALRTAQTVADIERTQGRTVRIRARRGVVLSTGSFSFNRAMVRQYAPKYIEALPLGTLGCDGSGLKLGQGLGGALGRMDSVSAWRSISPPAAFIKGIVVNRQGQRFIGEDVYLGKLGYHLTEEQGGRAWVVVDRALYRRAFAETLPKASNSWLSFGLPLLINLLFNMPKAGSPRGLAERCGIDARGLEATVAQYNAEAVAGRDGMHKAPAYLRPFGKGPYYALDISIGSKRFPCPTIPMGGLVVDEGTGGVLRTDGTTIAGLYAAGRAAVGIPSGFYVSGTSIADCVFSGRRAGFHAASGETPPHAATQKLTKEINR
jgi:3-oxo-5alpha-steroid 4-dehydrogenase